MGYSELKNWEAVFSDVNCIRIMLYLAKYNPNKQFEEIREKLDLPQEEVDLAINKLIRAQMLEVEDDSFTLKGSALIGLENFISLTKPAAQTH